MCPEDTSPEAWKVFLDIQRRLTPEEKIERCLEWSGIGRAFAEAGLRQQYPNAGTHEILLRYARMTLGPDLFRKAYGDVLSDEPSHRNT